MQFKAQDENGNSQIVRVISVGDGVVADDRNHSLAGKTLFFDIDIVSVEADPGE
ncbi:MAG: hypothetical protein KAR40_12315 [Candidatus Sabulitectum sp.]|nr:hypothetical protein [Candidatus Sabulitectum sp.]